MDKPSGADKSEAKYVNTPETGLFHKSDNLYGLNLARKSRKAELIIVEGYMDVLAMHQFGFTNAVGVLGTALNESHVRLLKNAGCTSVVLILDGDEAGVRATLRAIPILTKGGIKVKTLDISATDAKAKDPDDFLQMYGAAPLQALLKDAKSHVTFQVGLSKQKHDMDTTEGRVGFTEDAAKLLSSLTSAIETDAYVAEIAKTSNISASAIHAEINKQKGMEAAQMPAAMPKRRMQYTPEGRGVKKAKEILLHLILTFPTAAAALQKSEYVGEAEMGNNIYTQLLSLAFNNIERGKKLNPVDVITAFESDGSHVPPEVTELFIDPPEYDSKPAVEKALNETAFIIKRAWALSEMKNENQQNDPKTLQTLGFLIRNMPTMRI